MSQKRDLSVAGEDILGVQYWLIWGQFQLREDGLSRF